MAFVLTPWQAPPARPALAEDEVHLWRFPLVYREHLQFLLDEQELQRARRLRVPRKAQAFITARARLRQILARYLDQGPESLHFDYGAAGKPVLVDPKAQDFSRYHGATAITPNMAEFEMVAGPCQDEEALVGKGARLLQQHNLDALLVTRGEHGMTLLRRDAPEFHLPTQAREVFDVTGAGDTVIATLATGLASGLPMDSATQLANTAACVVVAKLGTATATTQELAQALAAQRTIDHGVVEEGALLDAVAAARVRGETIVMTNGCFDILHAGHVTYLEEASKLGDRLVVAVNVDETVRALKGADRPVNPLRNRMHVLAALGCVDWVVPFSEETPERLICELTPDYLVKGGDNDPDKIPGAGCVREAGGSVAVLTYVDGVSTTRIVDSIRGRR